MSLLDTYKDLAKNYGISDELLPENDVKLQFVLAQFEEIKKILWREIVDFIIASQLAKSDDEVVATGASAKLTEKRTNIRQFVQALKSYEKLIAELTK